MKYDLEERSYRFAEACRNFTRNLEKTIEYFEYRKQLIRSAGSQAANYIEANEALSREDFILRIKICIKETKESILWLRLCICEINRTLNEQRQQLIQESGELLKIYGKILAKAKAKMKENG